MSKKMITLRVGFQDTELESSGQTDTKKRATHHEPHVSTQQTNNLNFNNYAPNKQSRFTHVILTLIII
jgi:hypothetical protein